MGSKAQNSTSSEHGHVAYQIKRNHKCSNMVGNNLPEDAPPPSDTGGVNVKIQLFQNITMLHIFLMSKYDIWPQFKCQNRILNVKIR